MTRMSMEEYRKIMGIPTQSKYGNIITDGRHSEKERNREEELRTLERYGKISNLRCQVPFELIPAQRKSDGTIERAVKYVADFTYEENGKTIVEDVKSPITKKLPAYILKRKLMLFIHEIEVRET